MLKILTKLFSILLALAMLLTFVGCQFVEDPDDTDDEVVGGGLIQARDGEIVEDEDPIEVEDPVVDTVEEEDDTTAEPNVGNVDSVGEEEVGDEVICDDVENSDEDDAIAEEPVDEYVDQIELQDISSIVPEEGISFYALVLTVGVSIDDDGGTLQVCGLTCNDINHSGLFTVEVSPDAEILNFSGGNIIASISDGDIVAITYDGDMLETYPVQLQNATRVYFSAHIDRLAEIEYLLPEGYENFGQYFPAWDDFEY